MEKVARAIHAVHEQGVVHRDLKPANVLLASDADVPLGEAAPKIADFGLAKFVDGDGLSATLSRDVLGTPLYMAPEQAAGQAKEVGPPVDIYALGVMLYVLLTGQPPFKGATLYDTLTQIRNSDPVPPRRLLPQVPRDLETICLKCLQKEPRKRYATAEMLADDLGRYLAGKPIVARSTAWWERCAKWARREPRVALLMALIGLVTLAGLITTATLWRVAERRAKAEAEQRRQTELQLCFFRIGLADRELQAGRTAWAREQLDLCPTDLRRWEWHYTSRRCENDEKATKVYRGDSGAVSSVAFSLDGNRIATSSDDGLVRVWGPDPMTPIHKLQGHRGQVNWVAFGAKDDRLASAGRDAQVIVWNAATGEKELVFSEHTSSVSCVVFSPRDEELASATLNTTGPGEILIWNRRTGSVRAKLLGHAQRVTSLAYSPDGTLLYSASHDHTVRVWNTKSGRAVQVIQEHSQPVSAVAVSSDGTLLASAAGPSVAQGPDEGEILVRQASTTQVVHRLRGHRGRPLALAFSPDGLRLATAGWDSEIKLWDLESGQEVLALHGHQEGVMSLAFSRDGSVLASAGIDKTARLWSGASDTPDHGKP
jgi:hypothetical protein